MTDLSAVLTGFAALDEEALARPWTWRGGKTDVHYALYGVLEEAQGAYVRAAAGQHPESRRILALAQRAFGDLRGLLIGLPADLLEAPPRPGEWSIGETLRHLRAVEQRYALHTLYAVERSDSEPVRIPDDRLPPTPLRPRAAATSARSSGSWDRRESRPTTGSVMWRRRR